MSWHLVALNWLLHAAVGSSLFLLAGALAVRWCRQPVRRIRLIELALSGALLLPWVGQLPGLPRWSAGWLPLEPESGTLAGPDGARPAAGPGRLPGSHASLVRAAAEAAVEVAAPVRPEPVMECSSEPTPAVAAASQPPAPGPSLSAGSRLIVFGYSAVVAVLLIRMFIGLAYLSWLRHQAYPVPQEVLDLFARIAGAAGQRVRLLASDAIELPLALPGWRPTILLPGALCRGGNTVALRYGLAHEWSHVERGDLWRWNLATLAQPFFFYQPLFWWLRWQLRLCQDYLADARAAEQAAETEDYAAYLVALAARRHSGPALALGIGDHRSNLYRRITMLLQTCQPLERRCVPRWTLGTALTALLLLIAASAVRLDAGAPAEDKQDTPKETPQKAPKDKPAEKGETLHYTGTVTDKDTGKPIAGATVTVRRSLYGDPEVKEEDRLLEESCRRLES